MNAFKKLGTWYVLATPVLAGFSTMEFKTDEGFTVTGLIWVMQFIIGLGLLPFVWSSDEHRGDLSPWWPWLAWCGLLWLSLTWCENLGRRNVHETMQLSMPILVGMIAASVIRTREDLQRLLSTFNITFVFLALFTALYISGRFDEEWMGSRVRPAALTMTLIGCVYLAGFPRRKLWPLCGWGVCLLMTLLTQSRMATLTLLAAPIFFPLFRRKWINVAAFAAVAGMGIALFYTPIIQKRFFENGSGGLSEAFSGDYASAGRSEAWPAIWAKAWDHPILGSGVGSAFDFVPLVWEDVNHVHNDYLRMFFELGAVGEVVFLFAIVWQIVILYRRTQSTDGVTQKAFTACWLGWCAMLISCGTDNTILYNVYYTNLLFALIGGAYGVYAATTSDEALPEPKKAITDLGKMRYRPI